MNDQQDLTLTLAPDMLDYVALCVQQHPLAVAHIAQQQSAAVLANIQKQIEAQQPRTGHQEESPSSGLDGAVGHLNGAGGAGVANGAATAS